MRKSSLALAVLQALVAGHVAGAATLAPAANIRLAQSETRQGEIKQGGTKVDFDIPRQSLADALAAWSRQSGLQVLRRDDDGAADLQTPGVHGTLSPAEALERMLAATGLTYEFVNERTVRVAPQTTSRSADSEQTRINLAQNAVFSENTRAREEISEELRARGIPEVMVRGSKILNMDIQRSRDDPQPYVVFNREKIEQSGAANVEDFLKQRLTMNTQAGSYSQFSGAGNLAGQSRINLRGLGVEQTLILIDGHRSAGLNLQGFPQQTDLNSIPLSAIERIEILPTTASGIYGGSATGGVVNVVLRRDYSGLESKVTYENTFDSDVTLRRIDVSGGFNLEDGKTNVLVAGSFQDQNQLLARERNFLQRGRAKILANNPDYYVQNATPPLGATTNIRSLDGSNLSLDSGAPLNSPIASVPRGYLGSAAGDGGAAFLSTAGQYNLDLADSEEIAGGRFGFQSQPQFASLMTTLRREFSPHLQIYLEAAGAQTNNKQPNTSAYGVFVVPAAAPTNPFAQDILVNVPVTDMNGIVDSETQVIRASTGAILKLPGDWMTQINYTWSRSRWDNSYPTALSPDASTAVLLGSLDVLADVNTSQVRFAPYQQPVAIALNPSKSTMKDIAARFSGPLWKLPAGAVTLSGLLERREEDFSEQGVVYYDISPTFLAYSPSKSQSANSVYLEALVPLISASNSKPGVKELTLQIAGRWDQYETHGVTGVVFYDTAFGAAPPEGSIVRATNEIDSVDPTFALSYQPVDALALRASYGTGFYPPPVTQLASTRALQLPPGVVDPRRGNSPVPVTGIPTLTDGNPNLTPEQSESWSAGAIFTPSWAPGLRVSLDWTLIKKDDNIEALGVQQILDNESVLPGRITRGPNLPGDPVGWAGPIVAIDATAANISRAEVEAYDMQLDYRLDTIAAGTFDLFALATWQPHFKKQLVPSLPMRELVGIGNNNYFGTNPLKFKATGGVTWSRQNLTLGWNARYFDSYLVADPAQPTNATILLNQGNGGRVASQIYHDVFASYRVPTSSWETELSLGVKNVFNAKPPFDANDLNAAAYYSQFGDPLLASYYLSLKVGFGKHGK